LTCRRSRVRVTVRPLPQRDVRGIGYGDFFVTACVKHWLPTVMVSVVLAGGWFAAVALNQSFALIATLKIPGLLGPSSFSWTSWSPVFALYRHFVPDPPDTGSIGSSRRASGCESVSSIRTPTGPPA